MILGVMTVWLNKAIQITYFNRDCHLLMLGHMALHKIKCILIETHLSNCTPLGIHYSTPDQRMVESGVTEGGENTASFHFQVLMFPSTSSQETSGLSRKQDYLFPTGSDIKCIMLNSINIFRYKRPILIVLKTFLFNDFYRLVSEIDIKRTGEKRCFLNFERSRGKKSAVRFTAWLV